MSSTLPRIKILLVEDNPGDVALFRCGVEDAEGVQNNVVIIDVPMLQEALVHLHGPNDYDIVALDLNLPDSTGLATLRAIRGATDTPVVIFTGDESTDLALEAMALGARDVVSKSLTQARAYARICRMARIRHERYDIDDTSVSHQLWETVRAIDAVTTAINTAAEPEQVRLCAKVCDHNSACLLRLGHEPPDRHETLHGCVFYDNPPSPKGT